MVALFKALQVILALSLLVIIHEFGHYSFAKLFKTRVEKFYLFFNPKISLVKFKRFEGRLHCKFFSSNEDKEWDSYPDNTEYGIGWLPLGGYCKIAGMVDESMDKEALAKEPQPYEFRSKPAWQRFFIMFGGVFYNFILAAVLYSAILGVWGEEYLKNDDAVYGVAVNDLSYEMGFRTGDRILAFDGKPVENFSQLQIDMVRSQAREALIIRDGDTLSISIDPAYIPAVLNSPGMFELAFPFVVGQVPEGSINEASGLEAGDAMVAVDGRRMFITQQIREELSSYKDSSIIASIQRDNRELDLNLDVDSLGHIGVMLETDLSKFFTITTRDYGFFEAIPAGIAKGWTTITNYVQELGLIFSPKTEAYKSVGSFIAIGRVFPASWDWYKFWSICALLSVMLGVLNLLPIPALDGGGEFKRIVGR